MDEEFRQRLAAALMQPSLQMPQMQFSGDTSMPGHPRFSGGMSTPAMGGVFGLSGEYAPHAGGRPEFGARLNYSRQF